LENKQAHALKQFSMAYGAALGGWAYIVASSSFSMGQCPNYPVAIAIAVVTGGSINILEA